MRNVLTGAFLALASACLAQVSITMEIQTDKKGKHVAKNDVTTTLVSDGRRGAIVTDMADGTAMSMIVDPGERHTTTVITDDEGRRSAVRMPSVKVPKGRQPDMGFDGDFEATGETREILGYAAEKYLVTQYGQASEVWVADVPGYDPELIAEGLGHGGGDVRAPDVPGMDNPVALEAHTTSKNGKQVTHMYVRAIAAGEDVDLGMLEVPAGVELQDMTALLRGLGGR